MTDPSDERRVLAALERDVCAPSILRTAARVAELTDATVEGVHAGAWLPDELVVLAGRARVPLRLLERPADRALVDELQRPGVAAVVVGPGRPGRGGEHPVGTTARHVAERSSKPVVVVPQAGAASVRPLRRLLLPLEGTALSSRPILEALVPLLGPGTEIVVLHVFTRESVPRMLDRPVRDMALVGNEFLARHCPPASRIELRAGLVSELVREVAGELDSDMVVLSWSQDTSAGRARVVREVLASSAVPVLLLPVSDERGRTALPESAAHGAS